MATATILFFSVEHFVPSTVERILRGFKPLLLLLQAPRGGNKPSVEVLSFQTFFGMMNVASSGLSSSPEAG